MAFGHDPYKYIAFNQFHIIPRQEKANGDAWKSSRPDHSNDSNLRDNYGGECWRYNQTAQTYDPKQGSDNWICPASSFHLAHINRRVSYYQIDGIRIDSVENVGNWDFLKLFRDRAHNYFGEQYPKESSENHESRFIVVGEELGVPQDLVSGGTLDGYWNEEFKKRLRTAIIGYEFRGDSNDDFETTVHKIVNCKLLGRGFQTGTQAVNYITSHDVGGDIINQRLYNYLEHYGVTGNKDKGVRAKLAFATLLTSVGIPMILAGEEFCDEQDNKAEHPWKQVDPVNFERVTDDWRMDLFGYVKRLVELRKKNEALKGDMVEFIDRKIDQDRKFMAWRRGVVEAGDLPVVVVANFSKATTESGEVWNVNGWPELPARSDGKTVKWREVGEGEEEVLPENVGKETVSAWGVKVYESYAE
jgi:pullulanase